MRHIFKKLFERSVSILAPPEGASPSVSSQRKNLLSFLLILAIAFTSIYAIAYLAVGMFLLSAYSVGVTFVFLGLGVFYKRSGNHVPVAYGVIFVCLLSICVSSYFTGGLTSPTPVWLLVFPIASGSILPQSDTIKVAIITLVVGIAYFVFTTFIPPRLNLIQGYDLVVYYFTLSCAITTCALFNYLSEQSYARAKLDGKRKNELLEVSADRNRQLVRILCHDIANPLTVVRMFAKIIHKKTSLEEANKIIRACDVQSSLLEEVRELEAMVSGKRDVVLSEISFSEVFEESHFIFKSRVEEKQLNLELDNQLTSESKFVAEFGAFTNHVFNNILSNAIKFSHLGGKIKIVLSETVDTIGIAIIDNGIGMPEKIRRDLFDPAATTSRSGTKGESGTGFGMPIAKSYMGKFGGDIHVDTRCIEDCPDNHGTTFQLTLRKFIPSEECVEKSA